LSAPPLPQIPQLWPYLVELPPGDYWWCACGRSARQPFCDGSHAGTAFTPLRFTVTKTSGLLWLCGCKHARRPPFCDGTHNRLAKGQPPQP
jgi:CDGSH iron-sulfur domain-containing protein 3